VTQERSSGVPPAGDAVEGWPVRLSGVTETIVATRGPNDRWNQGMLGISPPDDDGTAIESGETAAASARSFGRTRTRRNLDAGRTAYLQFTTDPIDVVDAALTTFETAAPMLAATDAWTRISGETLGRSNEGDTEILTWAVHPIESAVRERTVATIDRGRAAAIEATVPASRLDVDQYDEAALLDRLEALEAVVETAGDERTRAAFDRIDDHVAWRDRLE